MCGTLRHGLVLDHHQSSLSVFDVGMDAPQSEHFAGRPQLPWISPVEHSGAQRHTHLFVEVGEITGHQRNQKRGAADRAVNPRNLRSLNPELLDDLCRSCITAGAPHRMRPLSGTVCEPTDGIERESLGYVLWVAVSDPGKLACAGEHPAHTASGTLDAQILHRVFGLVR